MTAKDFTAVTPLFCELVRHDTTSAHYSEDFPSTKTQKPFADLLAEKCRNIGLSDVCVSEKGYVYAVLPSNAEEAQTVPVIGFIAHMDTSSACSGVNIIPKITAYKGGDIELDGMAIKASEFPILEKYIGQDVITAGGGTLLGADDKAGVAEILTACDYMLKNPHIKHGTVKIAFTPDEEVGRGADFFDVPFFGADFAYTIDGGDAGELEYECFNAARALFTVTGKSVHPGTAKGKMVNSVLIAADLISRFPVAETPQNTEGREGFCHIDSVSGNVEKTVIDVILRDFDKDGIEKRKTFAASVAEELNEKYGGRVALDLHDEYFNMAEALRGKDNIINIARAAMIDFGIEPAEHPIRGGTDGSRLSFMGLPCPNIFTGGLNAHGPYEFVPVESMEKACAVIVRIAERAAGSAE